MIYLPIFDENGQIFTEREAESLKIKNPFFSIINVIMYVLCFLCLEIRVKGSFFTLGVLVFTVLYIMTALILVYRSAPETFRLK